MSVRKTGPRKRAVKSFDEGEAPRESEAAEKWKKLPKEVQDIIVEVAADFEEQTGTVNKAEYDKHVATLKEKITVKELGPAVRESWAQSLTDWPQTMATKPVNHSTAAAESGRATRPPEAPASASSSWPSASRPKTIANSGRPSSISRAWSASAAGSVCPQVGTLGIGEMMVAHVRVLQGILQYREQVGVPVPQVVGAAVEVKIHQLAPVQVPESIAFATSDDQVDAQRFKGVHTVGEQVLACQLQRVAF